MGKASEGLKERGQNEWGRKREEGRGGAGAGEQATRRYSEPGRGCRAGENPSTCSPRADAAQGVTEPTGPRC